MRITLSHKVNKLLWTSMSYFSFLTLFKEEIFFAGILRR